MLLHYWFKSLTLSITFIERCYKLRLLHSFAECKIMLFKEFSYKTQADMHSYEIELYSYVSFQLRQQQKLRNNWRSFLAYIRHFSASRNSQTGMACDCVEIRIFLWKYLFIVQFIACVYFCYNQLDRWRSLLFIVPCYSHMAHSYSYSCIHETSF